MSEEGLPENEFSELMGKLSAAAPLLSLLGGPEGKKQHGPAGDREALLRALMPYLSPGRREAAAYLIRAGKLFDTLHALRR